MVLSYIICEHFIENNYVLIQMILSDTSFFQQETIREKRKYLRKSLNISEWCFYLMFLAFTGVWIDDKTFN